MGKYNSTVTDTDKQSSFSYNFSFTYNFDNTNSIPKYNHYSKTQIEETEKYKEISNFAYNTLETVEEFYYQKLLNFAQRHNYGLNNKKDQEKIEFYKNEINSINASCFTYEDYHVSRYGIDSVVPDYLCRIIYEKKLNFTPQQLIIVFHFF